MAKAKKLKLLTSRIAKPSAPSVLMRPQLWLNCSVICLLIAGGIAAYPHLRDYVDHNVTFPHDPSRVVLKNRPAWMTDFLAEQIVASIAPNAPYSNFDERFLMRAYQTLNANPWIQHVNQVRRAYDHQPGDIIEIDCMYRAPVALVQWGEFYSLVDAEAVKLPEQFSLQQLKRIMFADDGRVNIRLIQGVQRPPPTPGHKWQGDDLAAGLEMVGLLAGKPYAEEVLRVDVSNFEGRNDAREAHLVLLTRDGSQVRWGRPPQAKDAFIEVRWDRKLQYMQWLVQEFKRVDAGKPWVDLRFDQVRYPSSETSSTNTGQ
jgi:hypothetical protein